MAGSAAWGEVSASVAIPRQTSTLVEASTRSTTRQEEGTSMTWTTGSPAGMIVTVSGDRVDFVLDSCVDDAATWRANVAYDDALGAPHLDCESFGFTGTWTVQLDNAVQSVSPDVWDLVYGSCYAEW